MEERRAPRGRRMLAAVCAVALATVLVSCGGGKTGPTDQPSTVEAARFLTQATFGATSVEQLQGVQGTGIAGWLDQQFEMPAAALHVDYVQNQEPRVDDPATRIREIYPTEEMSYEAVWQQWLHDPAQLRARTAFALAQIVVISNVAPDLRPYAMSSYMDMLNRNAFGSYRALLRDVTLHPAMGYYLNMLQSTKDDPAKGTHPNENYAREVLQLFSIGLVQLELDGTPKLDAQGRPIPTYDEAVVKGFARAFTGWTFANATSFRSADENARAAWTTPMKPDAAYHSSGTKQLLDGVVLPAGGTPESDLEAALDNIFNHPNVGPFIGRQLIQRFVASNPSPAYIARVARVFNDNGGGVRGDLRAVVRAVLLDPEARAVPAAGNASAGKQREPVVRFAHVLRALGARSANGINSIHHLDSADSGLGQSPLLSPSVFNFYSPNFRQPGAIAQAGLYAPEFQITTETSAVGALNFFASLFNSEGYGNGSARLVLNYAPLEALADDPPKLVERLDLLLFSARMSDGTRMRLVTMLDAMRGRAARERVKAALIVTALSPDFVIQQ
jgi:uncharacterized protein (DUF1800 family)